MTIKKRLALGFLSIFSIVILMGLIFIWASQSSRESLLLLEMQIDKAELIANLNLAISEAVMPANDYIITGDTEYRQAFEKLDRRVSSLFAKTQGSTLFSELEMNSIRQAESAYAGLKRVSLRILSTDAKDASLPKLMEEMDYNFAAPAIEHVSTLRDSIELALKTARQNIESVQSWSQRAMFGMILLLAIGSAIFVLTLSRSVVIPLNGATRMLQEIAEGRGDLTKRLDASASDEIGMLSRWFNRFADELHGTVKDVLDATRSVNSTALELRQSSLQVVTSAQQQMASTETTVASVEQLHASVRSIAEEAKDVTEFAAKAATTSAEMSASLKAIAEQATSLESLTEVNTSSINEIVATLQQIFGSIDILGESSAEIVASGAEMDAAIKEVANLVKEQALIAGQVRESAAELGMGTMHKTRQGIDKVMAESIANAETTSRLDQASLEIDKIVGVITDLADETSLLSLNAAILAAQAGEHGRGFGVVATQIKQLAERTTASAKQIGLLVEQVRSDIDATVLSAGRTKESAGANLDLCAEAEKALEQIVSAAETSCERSSRVRVALDEQVRGLHQVNQGLLRADTMIEEIRKAAGEQKTATYSMLNSTETVFESVRTIREATDRSSTAGHNLSALITEVAGRMARINRATDEQRKAVETIFSAIQAIRLGADRNVEMTMQFDKMAIGLEDNGQLLSSRMANFHV